MGVTGVILLGFVLAHMIGNLKFYLSKQEIDLYGEALRDMPGHLLPRTVLLWTIRTVLILAFAWVEDAKARDVKPKVIFVDDDNRVVSTKA